MIETDRIKPVGARENFLVTTKRPPNRFVAINVETGDPMVEYVWMGRHRGRFMYHVDGLVDLPNVDPYPGNILHSLVERDI